MVHQSSNRSRCALTIASRTQDQHPTLPRSGGSDRFVGRGERVRCSTVTSKILLSVGRTTRRTGALTPSNPNSSAAGAKILRNRPLPCDLATSGGAFATAQDLKIFSPAFGGRGIFSSFRPQKVPFRPLKSPTPLTPTTHRGGFI